MSVQNIHIGILYFIISSVLLFSSCSRPDRSEFINHDFTDIEVDTIQLKIEKKINESSGLIKINDKLWTHNDSGGEPVIYEIDATSGKMMRTVRIKNTQNTDWEEITRDSTHIYVANFGNNRGNRKDLEIYKISIDSVLTNDNVNPEIIKFHYPEQEVFPGNYKHNFDAEALIVYNDRLYIFTKNWDNGQCSIYELPTISGSSPARLISTFDTKGTITGATMNPLNGEILLLGYNLDRRRNDFHPFVWILSDSEGIDFFSGNQTRYNLNLVRQAEAIVWDNENTFYVSAENENAGHASLYSITIP